ncbi:MAG TPA: methionine gamma-lyase [Bacteroidales bacterium]|nr:MAG: methionine gamma-lyase [Bacteroidetes bacterium GWF2_33_38]OFY91181.1 MAG: methionine gamma-lyase [Bacteroidetes bacterium RIFOXYA2_FULL_33_7]HBF88803.1 methionine gamma-lyase [Bacteroidales bacterium]
MDTKNSGFETKLIHAGDFHDEYGSAVTPIYQTSTFAFKNAQHGADLFAGKEKGFIYTRIGNPTIDALENKLAELENGYRGIALASGMAAVTTVYSALLKQGDHMISTSAVYGPSRGVMESIFAGFGVQSSYVDSSLLENIEKAIKPNTKLLYLETPANPTMTLTDIRKASEIAHKHNILVCVDNTFSSPLLQKPLDLGADISLHSLTKFINGHADIVGGALIAKDEQVYNKLRKAMTYMGGNMDPHQAYMVIRGVKTLALRMERSQQSAMKVAEYLEKHPKVEWIKYPGLKSFPQYNLAKEQMKGDGAMISFGVKGGFEAGRILMDNVKLALLAVSLGGVETLIQHPASMTHAGLSKENRLAASITDELVRFSVGIENVEDIIADLDQALKKI